LGGAVVVDVVGVGVIEGPDSPTLGAALANAMAAMMATLLRQPVVKSLRFMIPTLFRERTLGVPTLQVRPAYAIGFTKSLIQVAAGVDTRGAAFFTGRKKLA
jgi:hypothetical protein